MIDGRDDGRASTSVSIECERTGERGAACALVANHDGPEGRRMKRLVWIPGGRALAW